MNMSYLDRLKEEGDTGPIRPLWSVRASRIFDMADMYEFSTDGTEVTYFDGEAKLTAAIVALSTGQNAKIGMALGHGEEMPGRLQGASSNGYDIGGLIFKRRYSCGNHAASYFVSAGDYSEEELAVLGQISGEGRRAGGFMDPSAVDWTI